MHFKEEFKLWQKNITLPEEKKELETLSLEQITNQFSTDIQFGTAGAREIMALGPSKMNVYTVRKITYAFAKALIKKFGHRNLQKFGVVVFHDARKNSLKFEKEVIKVFSHFFIKTYINTEHQNASTPFCSYAIRQLQAKAGVMITASHNPKEYNGYKAYNEHGAQILPPEVKEIQAEMAKIPNVFDLELTENEDKIQELPDDLFHNYLETVKNIQLNPNLKRKIKIVFTPQNGVGGEQVMQVLEDCGYEVIPVKEQMEPDANFSYTKNPNPEIPASWDLAIEYAKKNDADIILASDPDVDRMGVMVKCENDYILLNGNETGAIFLEYILSQLQLRNKLPVDSVVISTFVSSHLADVIAQYYECEVQKTPTGFKWMGNLISVEPFSNQKKEFIFGFESSFGYLIKNFVRDKDGVQAILMMAEACNYAFNKNKTLLDYLNDIYQKHGYFYNYDFAIKFEGLEPQEKMDTIMTLFRSRSVNKIANFQVTKKEDHFLHPTEPAYKHNLIKFYFTDSSWLAIRPSGTEPKLKIYICCQGDDPVEIKNKAKQLEEAIKMFVDN